MLKETGNNRLVKNLPKFPGKSLFTLYSDAVVDERMKSLAVYINALRDVAWVHDGINKILSCFLSNVFGFAGKIMKS